MKAVMLLIVIACVGDLAVDHGAGMRAVTHAATRMTQSTADAFHDLLFAV